MELAASYDLCRDVTKTHSKTFYFASLFLPPEKRQAIWAVYAFCRTTDDLVDTRASNGDPLGALDAWRAHLIDAYDGRPRHEIMTAFADAAERFSIPIEPALDLLAGARRDAVILRYDTYDELLEYCYLVASTVGLMTSPVLGYEEGALPYGVALGRAMQMTNILRDVGEDARMGRIYLPAEDLRRFGYTESDLLAGVIDGRFVDLMKFEIARVRAMYEDASPGIALLAKGSRQTVKVALRLYRGILDEIERNAYDVFTLRAYVPLPRKVRTAIVTLLGIS
jgi:phytoene synthase